MVIKLITLNKHTCRWPGERISLPESRWLVGNLIPDHWRWRKIDIAVLLESGIIVQKLTSRAIGSHAYNLYSVV